MGTFGSPNCRRFGQSALFFAWEGASSLAVQQRFWHVAHEVRRWPGVREAVVAAANLTVIYDRARTTYDALAAQLDEAWQHAGGVEGAARTVEITVRYGHADGPDLAAVAQACRLTEDEVIRAHCSADYVVAFVGFQPGFAYLEGLDARLHLPRRAQPRTRVPAGSVAIAGSHSAVYPLESPGGWHLIGRTALRMFDPARDPITLLNPGDRVRFVVR